MTTLLRDEAGGLRCRLPGLDTLTLLPQRFSSTGDARAYLARYSSDEASLAELRRALILQGDRGHLVSHFTTAEIFDLLAPYLQAGTITIARAVRGAFRLDFANPDRDAAAIDTTILFQLNFATKLEPERFLARSQIGPETLAALQAALAALSGRPGPAAAPDAGDPWPDLLRQVAEALWQRSLIVAPAFADEPVFRLALPSRASYDMDDDVAPVAPAPSTRSSAGRGGGSGSSGPSSTLPRPDGSDPDQELTLILAAQQGVPFCAECARLAQQNAAAQQNG
jgi:hypothetical protein